MVRLNAAKKGYVPGRHSQGLFCELFKPWAQLLLAISLAIKISLKGLDIFLYYPITGSVSEQQNLAEIGALNGATIFAPQKYKKKASG